MIVRRVNCDLDYPVLSKEVKVFAGHFAQTVGVMIFGSGGSSCNLPLPFTSLDGRLFWKTTRSADNVVKVPSSCPGEESLDAEREAPSACEYFVVVVVVGALISR